MVGQRRPPLILVILWIYLFRFDTFHSIPRVDLGVKNEVETNPDPGFVVGHLVIILACHLTQLKKGVRVIFATLV